MYFHWISPYDTLNELDFQLIILILQAQKTKLTGNVKKDDFTKVFSSDPVSKLKEKEVEDMEVAQMTSKLAEQLNIPVDDIDTADSDNPQLCAEYVKDIYKYMRDLEVYNHPNNVVHVYRLTCFYIESQRKYHVLPTYMEQQPQINSRMRAILIDWLIQVHLRFTLLQETLYLTVSIIDRYLSVS